MGNRSSKKKEDDASGGRRVNNKRSSFKDSIRSLANRRPKEPEEIPEDKGPKIKLEVPVENYTFPFENIVFEECLEELGIWRCITRIAATNTGSMAAALLSVGYNSYQLERYLSQDLNDLFIDHSCGCCGFYNNINKRFGWNPAKRFYRWFGERVKDAAGNADITFLEVRQDKTNKAIIQVYQTFGRELCIVVTNVSQMTTIYCHPKTTPDLPIRVAVRMALTTPGLVQPVKYRLDDYKEYFADGGILCNYPIHCFDGWWLSLKPNDSFLVKLHPFSELGKSLDIDNRFGGYSDRTIGCLVYADYEEEGLQYILEQRSNYKDTVNMPDTKLAKKAKERKGARKYAADKHADLSIALKNLLEALKEHGLDESKSLTKNDMENILSKRTELSDIDLRILFGKNCNADTIFKILNVVENEKLEVADLIRHMDNRGLRYYSHYLNYRRKDINTLGNYILALNEGLLTGAGRSHVQKRDLDRTVGINTYHVGATDFNLTREDRKFLVEQGKLATKDFLEYFVTRKIPVPSGDKNYENDDMSQFIDDGLSEIIDHRDYMEDFFGRIA
ncbi:hypothetical protein LSH36_535g01018 [Paralvinella palmiformis]|uniref:PNPLA domain-containing protein n=1 Tax=Paralvinella palmiformis TaxID=53620 RepID=A0AAD9J7Y8_9ANNE|nr:hypothetical protein LSH36_535g01018 [Paralvinella palmiformis]